MAYSWKVKHEAKKDSVNTIVKSYQYSQINPSYSLNHSFMSNFHKYLTNTAGPP